MADDWKSESIPVNSDKDWRSESIPIDATSGISKAVAPISKGFSGFIKPVVDVSEALEPITGAPVRAAIGNPNKGAFVEQMTAGLKGQGDLPTTPSGEQLTYRGMTGAGINPQFSEKTAATVGPFVSGMLDLTNLPVPELAVLGAAKGGIRAAELAKTGLQTMENGVKAVAKPIFQAGETFTRGGLDAAKAMDLTNTVSPIKQMMPPGWKGDLAKTGISLGMAKPTLGISAVKLPEIASLYHQGVATARAVPYYGAKAIEAGQNILSKLPRTSMSFKAGALAAETAGKAAVNVKSRHEDEEFGRWLSERNKPE